MTGTTDISTILENLAAVEAMAGNDARALNECEEQYRELVELAPHHPEALRRFNQFRLRNLAVLPQRPQILVGTMGRHAFPNVHTFDLIRYADVVSLTIIEAQAAIDRIPFNPYADSLQGILARLPEGFTPLIFWDIQVDGRHLLPSGLEEAPFPTAAGIHEVFRRDAVRHAARLFDVVVPLSSTFVPHLKALTDRHVLDIPFGLNWAAMGGVVAPAHRKEIDVAITFDDTFASEFEGDLRARVIERIAALERRHPGRFTFRHAGALEEAERLELLARSRIAVNVVGIHGPYNRVTCEALAAGCLLLQLTNDRHTIPSDIGDYFRDGEHLVQFRLDELEEKLLHYLSEPMEGARIAEQGRRFAEEHYGYDQLYLWLFEEVAQLKISAADRPNVADSLFHQGLSYWHSENPELIKIGALLAVQTLAYAAPEVRDNNLLVLLPQLARWFAPEMLSQLLSADDTFAEALRGDTAELVEGIAARLPDRLLHRWNRLAARLELGRAEREEVEALLADLERGEGDPALDDETVMFNSRIRADHLSEAEERHARIALLDIPRLRHGGNPAGIARAYHDFMTWHCHRRLAAEGDFDAARHLKAAAALLPDNPTPPEGALFIAGRRPQATVSPIGADSTVRAASA
ncbi:glycosyltransferase [Endothiovibrio diazotrophicus]